MINNIFKSAIFFVLIGKNKCDINHNLIALGYYFLIIRVLEPLIIYCKL